MSKLLTGRFIKQLIFKLDSRRFHYSRGNPNVPFIILTSLWKWKRQAPCVQWKVGQIGRVTEVWDNHFSFPFMCRTEGGHMIKHTTKAFSLSILYTKILWAFFFELNITLKYSLFVIVTDRRNSRQGLLYICIQWTGDINIWWWIYLNAALQKTKSQSCKYTDKNQLYSYVPKRIVPYDD